MDGWFCLAPDHLEPLKRNAKFKESFLKTLLQSPLPGDIQKRMTVVPSLDEGR